jgi:hypothetical protein
MEPIPVHIQGTLAYQGRAAVMAPPFEASSNVLAAPYEFWTPKAGRTIRLDVVRFEAGTVLRDLQEPPYSVVKLALRTWVPPESKPDRPPYWDWTAKSLVQRLVAIYRATIERALTLPADQLAAHLEATSPVRTRPLPLLITRTVHDGETEYVVQLGEVT